MGDLRDARAGDTYIAENVFRGRTGAPLLASALELAMDDVPIKIQKVELLKLIAGGACKEIEQRAFSYRSPAQARDYGVAFQLDSR